jgi:CBS domain containing-hemolysin-like protein
MEDAFLKILVVFFFVFLNAFFVAAEFAIVKTPPSLVEELARRGRRRARIAHYVIRHMDAYLTACQLGITLASLALGWIGEPFVARMLIPVFHFVGIHSESLIHTASFVAGFSIITFLHIVLGEVAPKSFAIRKSFGTVLNLAPLLRAFYIVFYPVIFLTNEASLLTLRLFGISSMPPEEHVLTEAEIRSFLGKTMPNGEFTENEARMLRRVLDFHDLEAHQIIVPRPDIVFLRADGDLEENLHVVESHGHTRFPLCEGNIDRVIGFVHVRDLYRAIRKTKPHLNLRSLKREILFFPEHTPLDTILREFQRQKVHLAIVLDEYGGTLGMLTLEDVIEELVGEIQDEFDRELPAIQQVREDEFLLDGGCSVSQCEEVTGLSLPETEADTVAGVILETAGDIPELGVRVTVPGGTLVVEGVKDRRITRIRLHRRDSGDGEALEAQAD